MTRAVVRARRLVALVSLAAVAFTCGGARPVQAALPVAERAILDRFLSALHAHRYDAAFALLSPAERSYFKTSRNYASSYLADRVKLDSFQILGSTVAAGTTVAIVSERLEFFSHKLQQPGSVTVRVAYGIARAGGSLGIKDPYHPWRSIVPDWSAGERGVRVFVRKISFFTGRVELLLGFENRGDATVTILPYGRSVLRDDAGVVHRPIATKLPGLTDAELYRGLRLPPSARYTGALTFFTADRFVPKTLSLSLGPLLLDGADAPFELEFAPRNVEH